MPSGNPRALAYPVAGIPNYPRVNQVEGLAESQLTTIAANLEYELAPDITLYATGTYGERQAKAHQNYRQPNQVIATPGSNQPFNAVTNPNGYVGLTAAGTPAVSGATGTFTTPGELIFAPLGFTPLEGLREDDYGYTLGLKGEVDAWRWDVSRYLRQGSRQDLHLELGQPVAVQGHPLHASGFLRRLLHGF